VGVLRRYDIIYLLMKLMKESIFREEGGVLKNSLNWETVRSKRLRITALDESSTLYVCIYVCIYIYIYLYMYIYMYIYILY